MATSEIRKNYTENVTAYEKVLIAVLFFSWGFLTQLNDILVPFLNQIFELSLTEALLIHFTFFTTYLVVAYPAGKLIDAIGYKKGIVSALLFSSIGCFVFYIAANIHNYELFLLALIFIASGITTLQIAANGYIVLHADKGMEASELTFAQVFNSFARVIAFLIISILLVALTAKLEILHPNEIKDAISDFVKGPYLFMALLIFVLSILFFLSKLPELTTKDLPTLMTRKDGSEFSKVLQIPHVTMGALAIFCYVGAEVSIGTYLSRYLSLPEVGFTDEDKIFKLVQYYWASAMIGRIFGGFFLKFVSPKKAACAFALGAAALVLFSVLSSGEISGYLMVGVGLFNSILFPTLFTMGISGLGHFAEEGASVLIASIVGGAVIPLVVIFLAESVGFHMAFLLPILCYSFVAYYAIKGSNYTQRSTQ